MPFDTLSLSDVFQSDGDESDSHFLDVARAIESGIGAFACSKSSYHEEFLRCKARDCSLHNTSRTYVMINKDALLDYMDSGNGAGRILGAYFTIGISSISLTDEKIGSRRRKKLKAHTFTRDNTMGCFVIGELCRSDHYGKSELPGLDILDACLGVIKNAQDIVGGRIVLVDSRKAVLESLYAKRGFRELGQTGMSTADGERLITSVAKL